MGAYQVRVSDLQKELKAHGSAERALQSAYYFKTGPGEYGEGDVFLGVNLPNQRKIAKKYEQLSLSEVEKLLKSKIHEERLTASIILVAQYKKGSDKLREQIYNFYLANTLYINNWDIIDSSAPQIVGAWLVDKDRSVLLKLAKSDSIWERRIAMLSTFAFIQNGECDWTFEIADILLHDEQDLIQKATGWLLREVGKRVSQDAEEEFLRTRYKTMPRTTLRYAIERFDEPKRKAYLAGTI